MQVALVIFENGKLSKTHIYMNIHLLLNGADAYILLTYDKFAKFRKEHQPEVEKLQDPFEGLKFDYVQCLQLTSQLIRSLELSAFYELNKIHSFLHDYLSGSGSHSIFNQKGSTETNNIIKYIFCIKNLKKPNGEIIWENPALVV